MKERLNTAETSSRMGVTDDPKCRLCGLMEEKHSHLFFNCQFNTAVIQMISRWMQIDGFGENADNSIRKITSSRSSRFHKKVMLAVMGATIYFIWLARNDVVWNNKIDRIESQVHRVQRACIDRIYSVLPHKITSRDRSWLMEKANTMLLCS